MKVDRDYDFSFLRKPIGKMNMRRIALAVKSRIIVETQDMGINKYGRPFKPYSDLYSKVRDAAGRPTRVDMTSSAHMINSMKPTDETANSVVLSFVDTVQPPKRTLLQKAWRKLDKDTKNAFFALAAISKRKAGKSRSTGRRDNPSAKKGRRSAKALISGHPAPLASEKAKYTNSLRPWFGLGPRNGKRRKEIERRVLNLLQEIFDDRIQRR